MSTRNENAALVGAGVAVCAVCCAGPIVGAMAAIGLGTAAGFALFGVVALLAGAAFAAFVLLRRRRRAPACAPAETTAVRVELFDVRTRS